MLVSCRSAVTPGAFLLSNYDICSPTPHIESPSPYSLQQLEALQLVQPTVNWNQPSELQRGQTNTNSVKDMNSFMGSMSSLTGSASFLGDQSSGSLRPNFLNRFSSKIMTPDQEQVQAELQRLINGEQQLVRKNTQSMPMDLRSEVGSG
ncbi:MAG: hypothetical protein EZS28_044131, partial [Streblomastix strix]